MSRKKEQTRISFTDQFATEFELETGRELIAVFDGADEELYQTVCGHVYAMREGEFIELDL